MKICVFCSACDTLPAEYFENTRELGRWAAEAGHTVVFGGAGMGLMECLAGAVRQAGGRTIGVVPRLLIDRGRESENVDIEIPCEDLTDRKQLMMDQSDVFIALPGGLGTLDEIFSVVASATIGYHEKRVILYSMTRFWDPLVNMLDAMEAQGLMRGSWRERIDVAESLDDIRRQLDHF